MKYFLIKITPNKDDKNRIRDFSELDMNLANSERNAYKEMVEMGAGERESEREETSASQIHAGGIKNLTNKTPNHTKYQTW